MIKFLTILQYFFSKNLLIILTIISCLSASLISLDHILFSTNNITFPVKYIGMLGWLTISLAIFTAAYSFLRQAIFVWAIFFCVGFLFGPYLEPPSDPLIHLARTQKIKQMSSLEIPRHNNGLWHYSMVGLFLLPNDTTENDPDLYIHRIETAHAVVIATMLCIIFIVARRVGLNTRWSFFSCLMALLFMGTNRFSFFSYYSLAPSASSLMIYWLWIAFFFMKNCWKSHFKGILSALLLLPIILTNHIQEAVFLTFLVIVWILLNFLFYLFKSPSSVQIPNLVFCEAKNIRKGALSLKILFLSLLIFILYILPQFDFFIDWASSLYTSGNQNGSRPMAASWDKNLKLVISWFGLYLGGKVWAYRVNDTLGGIAVLIGALSFVYFYPGLIRKYFHVKLKIFMLSIFPFLIYFTPLFHFFWVTNVYSAAYYRLCYSSLFWLFFSYLLQNCESRFLISVKTIISKKKNY